MQIGNWVRRKLGADNPDPRWHRVESVIEGAAITKCGRRMEPVIGSGIGLEASIALPTGRFCQHCD